MKQASAEDSSRSGVVYNWTFKKAGVAASEVSGPAARRPRKIAPSGPSNALIENEFRHAWYSIHGQHGEKGYNWLLTDLQIGGVSVDSEAGTARATIKFTYRTWGEMITKSGTFVFNKFGDKWEIEDRDARDITSSTRFQMTP